MSEQFRSVAFTALVFMSVLGSAHNGHAANRSIQRLRVAPLGAGRSRIITARAGETISVQAKPEGEVSPAIFVYTEQGDLVAKNDESSDASAFEWEAPAAGRFRIVIFSNSAVAVNYTIATHPPAPTRAAEAKQSNYLVKPVFWATNRTLASRRPPGFESELPSDGSLAYGRCDVSIPRDHLMGRLEGRSILRLEFHDDPERHIAIVKNQVSTPEIFFCETRRYALRSDERDALVFVHGFNTSFEDAVRRTAQLAYDLGFQGPALAFSWPSQARLELMSYNKDRRNAELSADALRSVLLDLSRKANVQRINVIAHSMGNLVLTEALAAMASENANIRQIALLAPDIDTEIFRRLALKFTQSRAHITLYASSADLALVASQKFAGYPRAGQGGENIVVVPGIDSIDASNVDTSLVGGRHQYYADNSQILSDLYSLFRGNMPDKRFGLRSARSKDGAYWKFVPVAH
jgi:esterase/lipase superfamily enzyme